MYNEIMLPLLMVNDAYRTITRLGYFDAIDGNKVIDMNDSIRDIPNKMFGYLCNNAKGCCFVFAAAMMNLLEENGIENYMVLTPEGNGFRSSVLYIINNNIYVANPVEDIEYFTKNNIEKDKRFNYYQDRTTGFIINGNIDHNAAYFTLEDFSKKYGLVHMLPSFNQDITLNEALELKTLIADNGDVLISLESLKNKPKTKSKLYSV